MSDAHVELDMDGTGPPKETARERVITWLDDRLNPVLVKEVRQALRGKQFRSAFLFTVILSVIVAVSIVLGSADAAQWTPIGPPFFMGIFICLTIAVIGFVPMAAFTSMGAEWEDNTYDLLILSHLRPRHIVFGKLLGAGSQALLYFSIFTPYIAFTFLLGGVDLQLVLVSVPLLATCAFALSAFAVALSSLSSRRATRVGYMIVLAAALVGSCMSLITGVVAAVEEGIDLSGHEARVILVFVLLLALAVAGFSLVIASSRLAHSEENRSSGLRVLTFVLAGLFMSWIAWARSFVGAGEFVWMMTSMVIAAVTLVGIFLVSERESLGMRVKNHLPPNPALRLFLIPWLPGGGRGAIWLVLTLGMICLWAGQLLQGATFYTTVGGPGIGGMLSPAALAGLALWATMAYAVVYLLLPTAIFTNRHLSMRRTVVSRALIPTIFIAGLLVPMLIGFLTGNSSFLNGQHIGNPFIIIDRIERGSESAAPILLVGCIVLCLQAGRIVRGVLEVVRAPKPGAMAAPDSGVALERLPSQDDPEDWDDDA